jgi:hypothetical protein
VRLRRGTRRKGEGGGWPFVDLCKLGCVALNAGMIDEWKIPQSNRSVDAIGGLLT